MRQAGSLCAYGQLTDELCRDKFIFGLKGEHMRTELLKTHVKPDNSAKTLSDVVAEARAIESAMQANKLIVDSSKGIEEEVHWTNLRHSQMKLRREPGTCFWCGDRKGPHPWKVCPANGRSCSNCGGNDHFARVCMEDQKPLAQSSSKKRKQLARGRLQTRPNNQRGQRNDSRTQSRDIHYTDSYDTQIQEQSYCTPPDTQYGFQYALDAQVHNIDAATQSRSSAKRYFTTLALSATGSKFHQAQFQIDTAATCNTISHTTLYSLLPDVQF